MTDFQIFQKCQMLVFTHFEDYEKTFYWMHVKNPHLGEISPVDLILRGRGKKVLKFIEAATLLNGNTK